MDASAQSERVWQEHCREKILTPCDAEGQTENHDGSWPFVYAFSIHSAFCSLVHLPCDDCIYELEGQTWLQ